MQRNRYCRRIRACPPPPDRLDAHAVRIVHRLSEWTKCYRINNWNVHSMDISKKTPSLISCFTPSLALYQQYSKCRPSCINSIVANLTKQVSFMEQAMLPFPLHPIPPYGFSSVEKYHVFYLSQWFCPVYSNHVIYLIVISHFWYLNSNVLHVCIVRFLIVEWLWRNGPTDIWHIRHFICKYIIYINVRHEVHNFNYKLIYNLGFGSAAIFCDWSALPITLK